jgi:hypothetical protein
MNENIPKKKGGETKKKKRETRRQMQGKPVNARLSQNLSA